MQVVEELEDKFEVDADWVLPPIADLVPDGGRLDQDVRRLENTYFDTPSAGLRLFGVTLAAPRRRFGNGLAVEGSERHGSYRTAEWLQGEEAARRVGGQRNVACERAKGSIQVATMVTTRTAYRVIDAA